MRKIIYSAIFIACGLHAAEPRKLDPAIEKICRDLTDIRRQAIFEGKKKVKLQTDLREKADKGALTFMEKIRQTYLDDQGKLQELVKSYESSLKKIDAANLTQNEKEILKAQFSNEIGKSIQRQFNLVSTQFAIDNESFRSSIGASSGYFQSPDCKLKDGKVLVCYQCSSLSFAAHPNIDCSLEFGLDLATGEIKGLGDAAARKEYENLMQKIRGYSSSSSVINIPSLERGDDLPEICKAIWEEEKNKPWIDTAQPLTIERTAKNETHGVENSGRPQSEQLSKTVKKVRMSVTDGDGLLVGSTDDPEGRKAIARYNAGNGNYGDDVVGDFIGLSRKMADKFDTASKTPLIPVYLHAFNNSDCNSSSVKPLTSEDVIRAMYPEFRKGPLLLSALRKKALEVSKASSFDIDTKLNGTAMTFAISLVGYDKEGKKVGEWELPSSFSYYNFGTGIQVDPISLPGTLQRANIAVAGSSLNVGPEKHEPYSNVVIGHAFAHMLISAQPEKLKALIKEKNLECETYLDAKQQEKIEAIESVLEGFAK